MADAESLVVAAARNARNWEVGWAAWFSVWLTCRFPPRKIRHEMIGQIISSPADVQRLVGGGAGRFSMIRSQFQIW